MPRSGVLRTGPHFFKYPSLTIDLQVFALWCARSWMALVGRARSVLALRAVHAMDPTLFYVAGLAVSALFGSITVWPAWSIARRAGGSRAAFLAGLFVALNVFLVERAQIIEVDVLLAFFITLAVLGAIRLADPKEPAPLRIATWPGLAAGLATSTKYPGVMPERSGPSWRSTATWRHAGSRSRARLLPRRGSATG